MLHHADARDIVVRDAACAVSDVPYRLTMGGKSPHPDAPRGGWMKDYNNKGQPVTCDISWDEIMDLLFQSLAARSHAYVFTNDKNLREAMNAADRAGFRLHNVLLWNKRSAMPNRWYMKPVEFVLFLGKGKAFTINQPGSMSLVEMPWPDETKHPTEKPWPLLQRYIRNSTDEGASVFDPFMGSGSTGVAAAKLGREFIGIEIEREWFDVAEKRIAKAENEFRVLESATQHLANSQTDLIQMKIDGVA